MNNIILHQWTFTLLFMIAFDHKFWKLTSVFIEILLYKCCKLIIGMRTFHIVIHRAEEMISGNNH
jgi:hypothetical protein